MSMKGKSLTDSMVIMLKCKSPWDVATAMFPIIL